MSTNQESERDLFVYRVVEAADAERAFSGEDALENGGRWSEPGSAVVYTAGSLPLAALEALAHLDADAVKREFVFVSARVPARLPLHRCQCPPSGWCAHPPTLASKRYGARWLDSGACAVLAVPSVVVPSENNFLLDPNHKDFARIEIERPQRFRFDHRLLRRR
jgi:RES domain-containing protein